MNLTSSATMLNTSSLSALQTPRGEHEKPTTKEAFQDFVAGTFYKQMLKSLRQSHDKPAYFHGGQAEEMFRSQLDQQVAEDLARTQGAAFADPLYDSFQRGLGTALDVAA